MKESLAFGGCELRDGGESPTTPGTEKRRSTCPIAGTLDIVGDRWTLLIVRDLLAGKTRYGDFLASAEKIPTNILSDRLKRLERHGLIASELYSAHPPRYAYRLTSDGHELETAVAALGRWGLKHLTGTIRTFWPTVNSEIDPASGGGSD
jgi:DNA-binding HxlR family transcriptional regulator